MRRVLFKLLGTLSGAGLLLDLIAALLMVSAHQSEPMPSHKPFFTLSCVLLEPACTGPLSDSLTTDSSPLEFSFEFSESFVSGTG